MFYRRAALALVLILTSYYSLAQGYPLYQRQMQSPGPGSEPASLSGNVLSADNKPLKDVRVELRESSSGIAVASVYTNVSGDFEFPRVPKGIYEVVVIAGLEESRERIEMTNVPGSMSIRMAVRTTATDGNDRNSISVAQYKVPGKAREEFKKANKLSQEQKPEEAQKHLESALAIYPAYADAFTLRGILKLEAHDLTGALADLQKAIEADGNHALAYIVMGAAQNMESRFDDAIRSLERGQTLAPASWQACFEMGKALVGKARYEQALAQLDRAQALAPKDYSVIHLVKAHAMLSLNHYSDAMTELQAYLAKEPNGPNREQAQKMLDKARTFAARK
ncbi:MAG TPA: tetratricopeptide repeat protein [Candidatus Solibacter sp.]|nr:tetratricopeptide repeat protein [Candidatus Solibacter sp.]